VVCESVGTQVEKTRWFYGLGMGESVGWIAISEWNECRYRVVKMCEGEWKWVRKIVYSVEGNGISSGEKYGNTIHLLINDYSGCKH